MKLRDYNVAPLGAPAFIKRYTNSQSFIIYNKKPVGVYRESNVVLMFAAFIRSDGPQCMVIGC